LKSHTDKVAKDFNYITLDYGFFINLLKGIFSFHLLISRPNGVLILFGCCSQIRFFHLLIVFQRKSIFVDLVGYLLCLRSWPWHFQLSLMVQHLMWLFFRLRSWQRFTYHLLISKLSGVLILFGCCSQIRFCHLLIVYQRK